MSTKCIYCQTPIKSGLFCSHEHKKLHREKEKQVNIQGYDVPIIKSRGMDDKEVELQKKFIKKQGKRKMKEKLIISKGVI